MPECFVKVPPVPPQPELWLNQGGFHREVSWLPNPLSDLFNQTLSSLPDNRPTMMAIRDALGARLLENRHRGLFVTHGLQCEIFELHKDNRNVTINLGDLGSISVGYNGTAFVIMEVSGEVRINNILVEKNQTIPGSCVIGFGSSNDGGRVFVTFDMSHPEVVL